MRHLLSLSLLALLTACGTYIEEPTRIARTPVEHYAPLEDSGQYERLSDADRAIVDGIIHKLPPNVKPVFTLEVNKPELLNGNERLNELAYYLRETWPPSDVKIVLADGPHPLGLTATYMIFPVAEPCPNWHGAGIFNQEDQLSGHLGCATVNNMHLQIADPRDLVNGRSSPSADLGSATTAVERHYNGEMAAQHNSAAQSAEGTTGQ